MQLKYISCLDRDNFIKVCYEKHLANILNLSLKKSYYQKIMPASKMFTNED